MAKPSTRPAFVYKPRDPSGTQQAASQRGGNFDPWIDERFKTFKAPEGQHQLRILPPTWDDATHYGYTAFVHYGIGTNGDTYLCLASHNRGKCSICEAGARLAATPCGDKKDEVDQRKKELRDLRAAKRILVWVIDRNHEKDGPQVFAMPWTLDRDIAASAIHPKTQAVKALDDPDQGYDVFFKRSGTKMLTEYLNVQSDGEPSTLTDNDKWWADWLEMIQNNPIPSLLKFFPAEHIAAKFNGATDDAHDDGAEETKAPPTRTSRARPAPAEEPPANEPPTRTRRGPVEEPADAGWADRRPARTAKPAEPEPDPADTTDEDDAQEPEPTPPPVRRAAPAPAPAARPKAAAPAPAATPAQRIQRATRPPVDDNDD